MSRCAGKNPASVIMRRNSCFISAALHAGREHYILFNQNAANVVCAKLQSDLADLDPRCQPARLDVIDVVQIQPAHRQCLQIIHCGSFLNFLSPRRIFRRKNPGDKCRKSASFFLNLPIRSK